MIPCDDCGLERSCYWSRAIWQPHGCRYASVSGQQLRHCLANRKVFFSPSPPFHSRPGRWERGVYYKSLAAHLCRRFDEPWNDGIVGGTARRLAHDGRQVNHPSIHSIRLSVFQLSTIFSEIGSNGTVLDIDQPE